MQVTKNELEIVKSQISYNPETGVFKWKVTKQCVRKNDEITSVDTDGYFRVKCMYKNYKLHNLAWLFIHGAIPDGLLVDHKDGNILNNKLSNLRLANRKQNSWNSKKFKHINVNFPKGISRVYGKYVARVQAHGKRYHVGRFDTIEAAYEAYKLKAAELHGEFARVE